MPTDIRDLPITAANRDAVDAYDALVEEYLGSGPAIPDRLTAALAADSDMPMAHVLRGVLMNLAGRPDTREKAGDSLARAEQLAARATPRERQHVAALAAWCDGNLRRAIAIFEEILGEHPRDILALRLAHHLHFFLGDVTAMRDSVLRLAPHWDEGVPGYGFVLGCRAFGLEETGDYAAAETAGRRAVEIEPRDIWAGHAVAHVLEMQNRPREGIGWIDGHEAVWSRRGAFANHVWWHRALYHLELEEHDAVLDQFDRLIWRGASEDNLDITNAAALLLRLDLLGVAVGRRWDTLVEVCERRIGDHARPFNDVHFAMPLALGGRADSAQALLASMQGFAATAPDSVSVAPVLREAGIPVCTAILAYAAAEYGRAVDLLMPVRKQLQGLGGSWAQRDVFMLLLIESALRAGRIRTARGLLAERLLTRPNSTTAWQTYARALDLSGAVGTAAAARAKASAVRAQAG